MRGATPPGFDRPVDDVGVQVMAARRELARAAERLRCVLDELSGPLAVLARVDEAGDPRSSPSAEWLRAHADHVIAAALALEGLAAPDG